LDCRSWADCIIAMSEELPEALILPEHYPNYNSGA
jgi:hypothetical protein